VSGGFAECHEPHELLLWKREIENEGTLFCSYPFVSIRGEIACQYRVKRRFYEMERAIHRPFPQNAQAQGLAQGEECA
jgi:hypothetical protein